MPRPVHQPGQPRPPRPPLAAAALGQVGVGIANRFAAPALYGADVIVPTLAGIAVVCTS